MGATSQLTVLPAAASPRSALVMDRLQSTRVLFAAPRALYLLGDDGRTVLSVVTADGLALPGAVRLALSSTRFAWGVGPGEAVLVGAGSIQLPQVRIEVRRVWRPARVDEPAVIGDHDSPAALPTAPLWPDLVSPGEVSSSRVAALVGAGPGLTPAWPMPPPGMGSPRSSRSSSHSPGAMFGRRLTRWARSRRSAIPPGWPCWRGSLAPTPFSPNPVEEYLL